MISDVGVAKTVWMISAVGVAKTVWMISDVGVAKTVWMISDVGGAKSVWMISDVGVAKTVWTPFRFALGMQRVFPPSPVADSCECETKSTPDSLGHAYITNHALLTANVDQLIPCPS